MWRGGEGYVAREEWGQVDRPGLQQISWGVPPENDGPSIGINWRATRAYLTYLGSDTSAAQKATWDWTFDSLHFARGQFGGSGPPSRFSCAIVGCLAQNRRQLTIQDLEKGGIHCSPDTSLFPCSRVPSWSSGTTGTFYQSAPTAFYSYFHPIGLFVAPLARQVHII